jgi:hypothetical protein
MLTIQRSNTAMDSQRRVPLASSLMKRQVNPPLASSLMKRQVNPTVGAMNTDSYIMICVLSRYHLIPCSLPLTGPARTLFPIMKAIHDYIHQDYLFLYLRYNTVLQHITTQPYQLHNPSLKRFNNNYFVATTYIHIRGPWTNWFDPSEQSIVRIVYSIAYRSRNLLCSVTFYSTQIVSSG